MDRRSFLSLLTAPLIVLPTLEDIERLTWKRRLFPGWTPSEFVGIEDIAREALRVFKRNLRFTPEMADAECSTPHYLLKDAVYQLALVTGDASTGSMTAAEIESMSKELATHPPVREARRFLWPDIPSLSGGGVDLAVAHDETSQLSLRAVRVFDPLWFASPSQRQYLVRFDVVFEG